MGKRTRVWSWLTGVVSFLSVVASGVGSAAGDPVEGRHYRGTGDAEYLAHLETAGRMFEPDPRLQNLSMLYMPLWNGMVEGPTWDAWWIQNSYGTTYAALPLLREPFVTFLQNSQDLWFDQMGDGKRMGVHNWVAPDGALCDAAKPGWIVYKQGDGRIDIHDWGMEFTAAGVVMQAELLLISRDAGAIAKYLPKLERCVDFLESRRDPKNSLMLAGPAGNLLAPSYAGWKKPDGTYDKAYLAGLSVTYVAGLDRMIELEKLAGRSDRAKEYETRRERVRRGLKQLETEEGYFVRSLDPDGTKHGVFGAEKHGYFEASPNHDAIALRVVDDGQARRIMGKMESIKELRPHGFVIPNYPSYDDMYEAPHGLWGFGTWVNGGHWSTCEGRMMLAYARLGRYDDQKRSMRQLMKFADSWRMDNPLTEFGNAVYQPKEPINLCYDTFAPAAALRRGLFEYLYRAEELVLVPHIPPAVTELEQRDPVRWGTKRIYLATVGSGEVTGVRVNGEEWKDFTKEQVRLAYGQLPAVARVVVLLGGATPRELREEPTEAPSPAIMEGLPTALETLRPRLARVEAFLKRVEGAPELRESYEASHARLIAECVRAMRERAELKAKGELAPLPEASAKAADEAYVATVGKLVEGFETAMGNGQIPGNGRGGKAYIIWEELGR